MINRIFIFSLLLSLTLLGSELKYYHIDSSVMKSERNLIRDIPLFNKDSTLNMVVEIPAGSIDKWEVSPDGFSIKWEIKNNSYRKINYLPYVGNYGMLPRTYEDPALNGDGDPLDIIAIGPARKRGEIVKVRIIGAVKLLDGEEIDDKMIAVMENSPVNVKSMVSLNKGYPGIEEIIKIWFANYKGQGVIKVGETVNQKEAMEIIKATHRQFLDRK